jgi:hypothetical protein
MTLVMMMVSLMTPTLRMALMVVIIRMMVVVRMRRK